MLWKGRLPSCPVPSPKCPGQTSAFRESIFIHKHVCIHLFSPPHTHDILSYIIFYTLPFFSLRIKQHPHTFLNKHTSSTFELVTQLKAWNTSQSTEFQKWEGSPVHPVYRGDGSFREMKWFAQEPETGQWQRQDLELFPVNNKVWREKYLMSVKSANPGPRGPLCHAGSWKSSCSSSESCSWKNRNRKAGSDTPRGKMRRTQF